MCPAADVEQYYHWCWDRGAQNATLGNIANAIRLHYGTACHDLRKELHQRSALANAGRLTMPVYLRHGDADALIPVDWTRQLAAKLKAMGRPVRYDEVPGGDHDSPIHGIDWGQVLDAVGSGTRPA